MGPRVIGAMGSNYKSEDHHYICCDIHDNTNVEGSVGRHVASAKVSETPDNGVK